MVINRHEVSGRRHFDLAHELFHILTWDAMPPEHAEEAVEVSRNRIEQLANSFASAVLMPAAIVDRFGDWGAVVEADLPRRLMAAAEELRVTGSALKWRLAALGRIGQAAARAIPDAALRRHRKAAAGETPLLFSRPFVEIIGLAIAEGRVSTRRAAGLLDMTLDDLKDLFAAHGVRARVRAVNRPWRGREPYSSSRNVVNRSASAGTASVTVVHRISRLISK